MKEELEDPQQNDNSFCFFDFNVTNFQKNFPKFKKKRGCCVIQENFCAEGKIINEGDSSVHSTTHTYNGARESGQGTRRRGRGALGTGRGGKEGWKRLPICGERGKEGTVWALLLLPAQCPSVFTGKLEWERPSRPKKTKVQRERGKHPFVPPFQNHPKVEASPDSNSFDNRNQTRIGKELSMVDRLDRPKFPQKLSIPQGLDPT